MDWETDGDMDFLLEATEWRGDAHLECNEPGWPEPEPPSEYHLLRDELEDDGA